jgi:putative phosphoserine phosphatase/1-acylglycerol-3-phosphate O-acyltransferase
VWPRSARLPNLLNVTNPPLVTVRVGTPVELVHDDPDADTRRILNAIVALLPPIARVNREPTPEELSCTVPPGHGADLTADHETERRPGTD